MRSDGYEQTDRQQNLAGARTECDALGLRSPGRGQTHPGIRPLGRGPNQEVDRLCKGALLFVMVPDDPESGMFYVYDRAHQAFWMVDPVVGANFGGYRLEEFEQLAQTHGLKALAQNPARLVEAN